MMRATLVVIVLGLCSCTNANISRDLASGAIGCPARDITILNETASMSGTHSWEAVCKDKTFICSFHTATGVNCKEAL